VCISLTFAWLCSSICGLLWHAELKEHPAWQRDTATIISGIILTIVAICVKPVYQNWEAITLPPLAATSVLVCFGLPCMVLGDALDTEGRLEVSAFKSAENNPKNLQYAWAAVWLVGVVSQLLSRSPESKTRNPVDLQNPYGGQNDLTQRLLEEQGAMVSRNELFESRFPILQGMGDGAENPATDPFRQHINQPPQPSGSGGILERSQRTGEPLTENEIKILDICREDEEQRNRILFGGGLW